MEEPFDRVRTDRHGTVWYHVKCPVCNDRSKHLGVGIRKDGSHVVKCLRCGSKKVNSELLSLLRKHHSPLSLLPHRSFSESGAFSKDSVALSEIDPSSSYHALLVISIQVKWGGLTYDDLAMRGARVVRHTLSIFQFPYVTLKGELGFITRKLLSEPKSKVEGVVDLCTFPEFEGRYGKPFVVVEGWCDACAVPGGFMPLILLGTGNIEFVVQHLPELRGYEIILMLDGDEAGREATSKLAHKLLSEQVPFYLTRLPEGRDPADLGKHGVQEVLDKRVLIATLKELHAYQKTT
jgi:hypothetical protein